MGHQQQQQRRTATVSWCWSVVALAVLVSTVCVAARHPDWDGGGSRRGGGGGNKQELKEFRELRENDVNRDKLEEVRHKDRRRTSGKHVLLHEAVRKLLGFPSDSGSQPRGRKQHRALLPDPREPPPMPQYVLDLYEKYQSGEISQGHGIGNTIRSVPAEIGEVNGEAMFIFNLSSIAPTEQVMRAHVHLFKRKSPARKRRARKRAETELLLYEVAPHYLSQTGSIIMRASSWGWQWYGATESVLSCLLADRQHPHLFALSFRAEKPNGKTRTLKLKKFVRNHSLPFLILYSNETENVNLEELDIVAERLKQREDEDLMEQPEGNLMEEDEDADELDSDDDDDGDIDEEDLEEDEDDSEKREKDPFEGFGVEEDSDEADEEVEEDSDEASDTVTDTSNSEDALEQIKNNIQEGGVEDVLELSESSGGKNRHRKNHKNSRKLDHRKKKRNHKKNSHGAVDSKENSRTEHEIDVLTLLGVHKSDSVRSNDVVDGLKTNDVLPSGTRRKKRSILTNEIPEDPEDYPKYHYPFNLPQTHPGMLTARRESRHRLEDTRLIPYPQGRRKGKTHRRRRRKHRKRKNRKRNRKNRRKILLPEKWEDYHDNLATPDNTPSQVCSRRRLVVDFADIGWGDWIISPKSFEAHYCAGTCPFPLTKRLRPSNHATIQSIVNAIGLYSNVPAPCCVPDAMTSVTLLYFDENRNVVLKNYPGMSVQSCACR